MCREIPMKNTSFGSWVYVCGSIATELVTFYVVCESKCTKVASFQLRAFYLDIAPMRGSAMISFITVIVVSPKMFQHKNTFHKLIILFRMTG